MGEWCELRPCILGCGDHLIPHQVGALPLHGFIWCRSCGCGWVGDLDKLIPGYAALEVTGQISGQIRPSGPSKPL